MKIAAARKPGLVSKPGGVRTTLPPRIQRIRGIRGFEQQQGLQQIFGQCHISLSKCDTTSLIFLKTKESPEDAGRLQVIVYNLKMVHQPSSGPYYLLKLETESISRKFTDLHTGVKVL